jgi:hypothetical protein
VQGRASARFGRENRRARCRSMASDADGTNVVNAQGRTTLVATGLSVVLSVVVATLVAGWIMGGAARVPGPSAAGGSRIVAAPPLPKSTHGHHATSSFPQIRPNPASLVPGGQLPVSAGGAFPAPAPGSSGPGSSTGSGGGPACVVCRMVPTPTLTDILSRVERAHSLLGQLAGNLSSRNSPRHRRLEHQLKRLEHLAKRLHHVLGRRARRTAVHHHNHQHDERHQKHHHDHGSEHSHGHGHLR